VWPRRETAQAAWGNECFLSTDFALESTLYGFVARGERRTPGPEDDMCCFIQTDLATCPQNIFVFAKSRVPENSAFTFRIAAMAGFPYYAATTKRTHTLIHNSCLFRKDA